MVNSDMALLHAAHSASLRSSLARRGVLVPFVDAVVNFRRHRRAFYGRQRSRFSTDEVTNENANETAEEMEPEESLDQGLGVS